MRIREFRKFKPLHLHCHRVLIELVTHESLHIFELAVQSSTMANPVEVYNSLTPWEKGVADQNFELYRLRKRGRIPTWGVPFVSNHGDYGQEGFHQVPRPTRHPIFESQLPTRVDLNYGAALPAAGGGHILNAAPLAPVHADFRLQARRKQIELLLGFIPRGWTPHRVLGRVGIP